MSEFEIESPWYETVAIYVGSGALYLTVFLGLPALFEFIGGEWALVVVAAMIGVLVIHRTLCWAVRELYGLVDHPVPAFARKDRSLKWSVDSDGVSLREVGDGGAATSEDPIS